MVQNLSYLPPLGKSDHIVVILVLPLEQKKMIGGWAAEHNVLKTYFEAVKGGLNSLNWDDILKSDFQHHYNSFFDALQNLLEKHSPFLTQPYKKKYI